MSARCWTAWSDVGETKVISLKQIGLRTNRSTMKFAVPVRSSRLYKYTMKAYLDSILGKGEFRIGTLYEFRKYEHAELGDVDEGRKQFVFMGSKALEGKSTSVLNVDFPRLKLKNTGEIPIPTGHLIEDDSLVALEVHSPDCYIFCATEVYNPHVMRSFGYDACIEIHDPKAFFLQLCSAMRQHAVFGLMERCTYGQRHGEHDDHLDVTPALMKPEHLKHQHEVRMMWVPPTRRESGMPSKSNLGPLFIRRPKAAKYLRLLE